MRRILSAVLMLLAVSAVMAEPVDISTARLAGHRFLLSKGLVARQDTLTLAKTFSTVDGRTACFHVFNYAHEGFVIVSADTRCVPILGYSANGSFGLFPTPDNASAWLEGYRADIERGLRANAPENIETADEWRKLTAGTPKDQPAAKDETYLLTSTWEQGSGYNSYCPVMDGDHVVVGCVATAMAQIIRYWRYPLHGFGQAGYIHAQYGRQAVSFDTVEYNYDLMPDHVSRRSTAAEIDMVSRLCYHCGVTVHMNYQNPTHTTGSGAHSNSVPEALQHFGYAETRFCDRDAIGNDVTWRTLIRHEIDAGRPIYYSGVGSDGGHAFVLDGYTTQNRFHFNWGWGGYHDGFYALTTMQGFTSSNDMVIGIQPSGIDGRAERIYISPDGTGDGTSWQQANSSLGSATVLAAMTGREVWMLGGTYYGDTTQSVPFTFIGKVTLYGGFEGTETTVRQRRLGRTPTILSGGARRAVLVARAASNADMLLDGLTLADGYTHVGNCVELRGSRLKADNIIVQHCVSDSGHALLLSDSRLRYARLVGNQAPTVCRLSDATLRQSLVASNDGSALLLDGTARVVNSTIVRNTGKGATFNNSRNTFVNNIVWGNDTAFSLQAELADTCCRNNAADALDSFPDTNFLQLQPDNAAPFGPRFANPVAERGVAGLDTAADWRLMRGSCCINAGERLNESVQDGDLDRAIRCRQGFIDLGCYETNYPLSIAPVATQALAVYPNPATDRLLVSGCTAGDAVTLHDRAGRRLATLRAVDGTATFSLSALPAGIYYLRAQSGTVKVVKL